MQRQRDFQVGSGWLLGGSQVDASEVDAKANWVVEKVGNDVDRIWGRSRGCGYQGVEYN